MHVADTFKALKPRQLCTQFSSTTIIQPHAADKCTRQHNTLLYTFGNLSMGAYSWPSPSVCSCWFASTSRPGNSGSEAPLLVMFTVYSLEYTSMFKDPTLTLLSCSRGSALALQPHVTMTKQKLSWTSRAAFRTGHISGGIRTTSNIQNILTRIRCCSAVQLL